MSQTPKIKVLTTLVVLLIVLNVVSLGYIWYGQYGMKGPAPRDGRAPAGLVIRELQFDKQQEEQFEKLRDEHRAAMRGINSYDRALHDELFRSLAAGTDTSAYSDSLIHYIALTRIENEQITYHHLALVRRICTPEQQQKFDAMIADAMAKNAQDQHQRPQDRP